MHHLACCLAVLLLLSLPAAAEDAPPAGIQEMQVRAAVTRSLVLLEQTAAETAGHRTCFTCHGQALPVLTCLSARRRGFAVDADNLQRQLDHTLAHLRRGRQSYLTGGGQGGKADMAGYALWMLAAMEHEPDETTEAVTGFLLRSARHAGYWQHSSTRPPAEGSNFTTTFVALTGLLAYGTGEQQPQVAQRREATLNWLLKADVSDTEDRVFRLRGLHAAGAEKDAQQRFAGELLQRQRDDGGWAQKDDMTSDAYATGTALACLLQTGHLAADSAACRRGIRFLLDAQAEDGSWHVASRSRPFQTHFESGYPHGKDQFISATAAAWSTLALLLTLPENPPEE